MKKMMILWLVLAMSVLSVLPAKAYDANALVTVRRSILINGEFQRQMPYRFNVPSVNCGTLEVSEMKKSNPFFGEKGGWEKKNPGESVFPGWYRFKITGADLSVCSPVIDFATEMPQWMANSIAGSFMEVEPEDLGLLVKGGLVPNNVFGLVTDDRQFSYELVSMAPGTERTLDSFKQDTHIFSDTGQNIVGAIVADDKGFLTKKVIFGESSTNLALPPGMPPKAIFKNPWVQRVVAELKKAKQDLEVSPSNFVVREGDVFVLIRDERLPR